MKRIDDIKVAAIRKAYLNRDGSIAVLAERFGVSEGTIKRIKKEGDWDAIRAAQTAVVQAAVQQPPAVTIGGAAINFDEMLTTAIDSLSGDVATLPGKSRESAATALLKAIELYRKYHPMTIDEAIDLVIALPGFDPQDFARRLRDRYLAAQANR